MESLPVRLSRLVQTLPLPDGSPLFEVQTVGLTQTEVVRVNVAGREELPIYVTSAEQQILCICYLWHEGEINLDRRTDLLEALLDLSLPMPLSSFGRIGEHYVVFGALSCDAGDEELREELQTLSDNAVDALDAFAGYLN